MKTVITIQHTQSQQHTNGMIGSWTDWDLTDLGVQQARRIAKRLAPITKNDKWRMYTSDLLRAKHTAEIISKALQTTPIIKDTLREQNLGAAVGKSKKWLQENIQRQELSVYDRIFDDAESKKDLWERLTPFVDELIASEDLNIILVSHGGTLSIFNAIWLGMDVEDLDRYSLFGSAGGVSFFGLYEDGKRIMRRLSDMSFIAE